MKENVAASLQIEGVNGEMTRKRHSRHLLFVVKWRTSSQRQGCAAVPEVPLRIVLYATLRGETE